MLRTYGRNVSAAAVALLVVGTACNDLQGPTPKLEALDLPSPQQREVSGAGTILVGSDMETTFLFDVRGDPTGTFTASDVMGNVLTTNTGDPNTSFRALRFSSSFCRDPSHGAEFDATGRLVERGVVVETSVPYTVKACDNGPGALGMDTWSIDIPSRGNFHRDGTVTGDIVKH